MCHAAKQTTEKTEEALSSVPCHVLGIAQVYSWLQLSWALGQGGIWEGPWPGDVGVGVPFREWG